MKPEIQPLPRKMWANLYLDSGFIYPTTKQRRVMKVGRNDPCPCGSGKKFKKCHLGQPA